MQGTYWLTVLPETSKLRPGIKRALSGVDQDAKITPTFDTKGAKRAGQQAGRDVQAGMESTTRGGGLGRLLRIDGARSAGQNAGREINAGIASANIGRSASSQLASNLTSGAAALGRRVGGLIAGGLKIAAIGAGTVAAAGLGAALTAGFSRLTAIDDAKFKLQGLGNSTEKVQGIMDNALAAVKGTAFGLDEAATTAATAVAAGIQPGEQLTKYLSLTADTAAIAGTSLADMGSIFNKVQTSGKAFTGDLNMLADRGLPVFTWLQEATGKTGEDFQKMVEDGKISSELFQEVVAKNIAGAAQSMGGSVRGSLSNLKASFSRFGAELSGPIFAGLKPLAIGLTGVFDSVTTSIKPIMADLTARVGPWAEQMAAKMKAWADNGGVEKVVAWFGQLRETLSGLMSGGGAGAVSQISESVKTLGPALQNAGPALAGVGDSMKAFGQAMLEVGPETLSNVMVPALQLLATTLKFVADNASWAVPTILGLVAAVGAFRAAGQTLGPIVGFLNGAFRVINAPLVLAQTAAIRSQAAAMTQLSAALGANTVSTAANSGAQTVNAATSMRARIAALASAAASKVATAAQWLWNAAMTANPIGIIIAAVVAAGVAIWAFFTKTETGRKLWDKIWTGIKTTVSVVWEWLKTTLANAWTQIGPSVMKIGDVAKQAFGAFVGAVKTVWTAIQPAIAWIGRLWLSVQRVNFTVVVAALKALGAVIGWLWTNVVVPAFEGIASAVSGWWSSVQVIWAAAQPAIRAVGDVIMWLWNNVAVPAFQAISTAVTTFWDAANGVWDQFTGALDAVGKGVGVFKDAFSSAFNAVKDVVVGVWNTISGIIDKIGNGIATVVDKARSIPVVGALIPGNADGKPAGFASGRPASVSRSGVISGPGTGTSDSILAMVSNDEGIVKASAMAAGGTPIVAALNSGWVPSADFLHAMLPGFADGKGPDISVAEQLAGTPYSQASRFDCSGTVARVINGALGMDGGLMSTKNAREWLTARGFVDGSGGPGQMSVGWYDHGPNPNDGHMAMTLSDGRNAESGGKNGVFTIGAGAAGADDPQFDNHMYLPQMYGEGAGSSSSLGAATSASAGSSRAVQSARTSLKNAGQAVDDRTYARDQAQKRLDEAKAAGKDTTDEQRRLDVANRELADAKEKQSVAGDRLAEAENKAATDTDKSSLGGSDFDDLGKSLWGGLMETIGLDGSVFSNPFEWPTIKSAIAGVNVLGKALSGGSGSATAGSGGDVLGGVIGGIAETTGLDNVLMTLNPAAADVAAAPASAAAPDTTQHGAGNGAAPGPGVYIENAGMKPQDVANTLDSQWNARTRTTKVH
jgi:tape measure domain-containing protein